MLGWGPSSRWPPCMTLGSALYLCASGPSPVKWVQAHLMLLGTAVRISDVEHLVHGEEGSPASCCLHLAPLSAGGTQAGFPGSWQKRF